MKLYINTAALSPAAATVTSEVVPEYVPPPVFVVGDTIDVEVYLVDGTGTFDSRSGDAAYDFRLGLGVIGSNPVALQDTWTPITNGWSAKFDLNTVEALALASAASGKGVSVTLEADITDASTDRTTVLQADTTLRKELIEDGVPTTTPGEDFYNTEETDEKFVHNRYQVSALTGGGASSLDGIATTGFTTGTLVAVVLSGVASLYKLTAGTDAESSPTVIRPDDYAATTNERVWKRVSMAGLGANPTASVGLTATNGTADTYMRSDAAPALDVSIAPTWTGTFHKFSRPNTGESRTSRVFLQTASSAVNGYQQYSPAFQLTASGWRDDTSVAVDVYSQEITTVRQVTGGRPAANWSVWLNSDPTYTEAIRLSWTPSYGDHANIVFGDVINTLPTNTTQGFLYIASMNGTPSGTPVNEGSYHIPFTYDRANNRLYAYNSGWQNLTPAVPASADPFNFIGLTPTNGVANTYMRSDAAPALSQSITPTWTSYHTWNVAPAGDCIRCAPNANATGNTDHKSSPVVSLVANVWNGSASTPTAAIWSAYGFSGTNSVTEMSIGYTEASFMANTRGDSLAGKKQALNTTDNSGFFYIRNMSGTPSGTPTSYSGMTPMLFDTSADKLWAYIGGAWKSVTLT